MTFVTRINYSGKNVINQDINIPARTTLKEKNGYIFFEGVPVCFKSSQIARDYFIWNDNDDFELRCTYEEGILFNNRQRIWEVTVPIYNEEGKIVDYTKLKRVGKFTPAETEYIIKNFPEFLEKDAFLFNDYFYIGAPLSKLKELYDYVNRQ